MKIRLGPVLISLALGNKKRPPELNLGDYSCAWCHKTIPLMRARNALRTGIPPRYCSNKCRGNFNTLRLRQRRAEKTDTRRQTGRRLMRGFPPFGYLWGENTPIPVPSEIETIKFIHTLRASGKSYAYIADELTRHGVPVRVLKRKSAVHQWYGSKVRIILLGTKENGELR